MRVLIDTNVLISAALSANGTPYQAYVKAASYPNRGLICEQNVDEMRRIFNKKFRANWQRWTNSFPLHCLLWNWFPCRLRKIGPKRRSEMSMTAPFCGRPLKREPMYC